MFRSPFLTWLKKQAQASNRRPARVVRDAQRGKLYVEALEDRTLLSATVLDVSTTNSPNSTVNLGQAIEVKVDFNGPVTVDTSHGTPTIALNDSQHSVATYVSGSSSNSLLFAVTGGAPANDTASRLDYLATNSLNLNGGAITDLNDADAADTTLPTPTSAGDVLYSYNIAVNSVAPAVTGVTPSAGPIGGGTAVTITGTNLEDASGNPPTVKFGNTLGTVTAHSATSITVTSPASAAGTYDITVTTANGTSATSSADQFSFDDVPTVTSLSAVTGPESGGTPVAVYGTNFTANSTVTFGGTAATSVKYVSATELDVIAPAGTGTVDVVVTTPGGASATGAADHFTYSALAPTVTNVSPSAGPVAGGTQVTITGTNLTGATDVFFGSTDVTSFTVNGSGTSITLFTPAVAAGTVNVTVTTPNGVSNAGQFTFAPVPAVTGISPIAGSLSGGTSVTITGTGFSNATAVKFGSNAATSFTVDSDTQITATTPAGSAGTVDVIVTTAGGTSTTTAADQFTYTTAPTVTNLSTNQGPTTGGTSVIITGSGFTGATAVKFGSNAATSYTVDSDTQITATAPAGSAGAVDITVTTAGGTSALGASDRFTYVAAPTITSVAPTAGPLGGTNTVTITGTGFTNATAVDFGGNAASFTVVSDTEITATAPAGTGTVDVTVTSIGGTSTVGLSDHYTYTAAPTVTGITPTQGPATGGTSVTITGTGFSNATAVDFGGNAASFTVVSDTEITATAPAGTGIVDVTVTTAGGTSATSASDKFTYVGAPAVTGITPTNGPLAGGTTVTITGTGFTGATAVHFGGASATNVTVVSDTKITATAPSGSAGTVDVTVTTVGGTSATGASDRFTYIAAPTITGIAPSSGDVSGGSTVTITGTGFSTASAVTFGNTSVAFHVVSDTQITATVPAGSAGAVDVRVTTVGGTSAVTTADQFTYTAPTPTLTPAQQLQQNIQQLFQDFIQVQINLATGNLPAAIQSFQEYQSLLAKVQQEIFQIYLNAITSALSHSQQFGPQS